MSGSDGCLYVDGLQPPKAASHWELQDQTLLEMLTLATGSTQWVTRATPATASAPTTAVPTLREKSLVLVRSFLDE